jgi:tryptophan synthase beta chain
VRFAATEGIIPAPEAAHAIRAAIDEAEQAWSAAIGRIFVRKVA